jgi:hypothetical protein
MQGLSPHGLATRFAPQSVKACLDVIASAGSRLARLARHIPTEASTPDSCRKTDPTESTLAPTGVGNHERAIERGETTDQLRTTTAELSAPQRSNMDTSDKWFTLDNRIGPIWGSRGREFKSRQPDQVNCLASVCSPTDEGSRRAWLRPSRRVTRCESQGSPSSVVNTYGVGCHIEPALSRSTL